MQFCVTPLIGSSDSAVGDTLNLFLTNEQDIVYYFEPENVIFWKEPVRIKEDIIIADYVWKKNFQF